MKLPNGEHASVSLARLTAYVLNPQHPEGRHKARVFASALGLDVSAAADLQAWLLELARSGDAEPGVQDSHGQRFVIRARMLYKGKEALVRTGWIIRSGEDSPDFLTAFVVE